VRRALRKTPEFLAQVEKAQSEAPNLLAAIAGAEFVLSRSPEQGMTVRGTPWSSWPVHPEPGVTFKIVYVFNDHEVVFRALYPAISPKTSGR
jgi:hypothetical protein